MMKTLDRPESFSKNFQNSFQVVLLLTTIASK